MPIHDWTRVNAGTFHDFHQTWTVTLRNALNDGVLPEGFFAMVEQRIAGPIADVLALELGRQAGPAQDDPLSGGVAVEIAPPGTRLRLKGDSEIYASRANQITIRHRHGTVIAVVEIVSPGNKHSIAEFRTFVEKAADLVQQGIHLMVIDLFPPTPRDPSGFPQAIWDQFSIERIPLPPDATRTISSMDAIEREFFVDFAAPGGVLPDAPLFIRHGRYVNAPLASSYDEAWRSFPKPLKALVEA